MRHLVRTLAVCVLLIGGGGAAVTAQTSTRAPSATLGIVPTGLGESVDRDVATARAATARFRIVDAAIVSGYTATTACVTHPTHGVMGLHYKKAALRDATVDAEHPEILLYQPMPDGSVRLNGVEYVVPLSAWTRPEPPAIMQQPMRRDDGLGIWYLHVWLWTPNPAGIFADWNPDARC